ncbi:hypothetical protein Tco_0862927 [Tanacetum coccineum]
MAEVHRLQNAGANKPPELKEPVFSSKSGRVLGRTLGTLDEQLHDMYTPEDESVTQIRSEIKAKRAARKIFINVAKPGSKMGRTPGDEKASKGALKAWVAQNDFPKRMRRGPIEGLYMESLESGKEGKRAFCCVLVFTQEMAISDRVTMIKPSQLFKNLSVSDIFLVAEVLSPLRVVLMIATYVASLYLGRQFVANLEHDCSKERYENNVDKVYLSGYGSEAAFYEFKGLALNHFEKPR